DRFTSVRVMSPAYAFLYEKPPRSVLAHAKRRVTVAVFPLPLVSPSVTDSGRSAQRSRAPPSPARYLFSTVDISVRGKCNLHCTGIQIAAGATELRVTT